MGKPFCLNLHFGLLCSALALLEGQAETHQKAWEADGWEGSPRLNCYWWKSTFPSLVSEPVTAKNICEWSVWNVREERLKRSTRSRRKQCQDRVGFILWPVFFLSAVVVEGQSMRCRLFYSQYTEAADRGVWPIKQVLIKCC